MSRQDRSPDVSVVVPVYNAASMIEGLIDALDAQTIDPARMEAILIDDGSTDGTPELIEQVGRRRRVPIVLLRRERNGGPAAARNSGLSIAKGRFIAFTDADCEPDPDWLANGLERLRDEVVDAVEGRTLPKGTPGPLTHQMVNTTGGLYMTCNMLYRREVIDDLGGFDERFRVAFLEDSDLALGLLERDGEIRFAPEVVVRHLVLPEGPSRFRKEARKRFYNPLLYRKHPATYRTHIATTVPGLPPLHLKYLASVIALPVPLLTPWPGVSVALAFPAALYARRVLHAYRAFAPSLAWRALLHPFVQTAHVIRGAIAFRSFSWRL